MLTILGQAIEAAFPVLRLLEPGEPEAFLSYTTLMHEINKRGARLVLAWPEGPDAPPLTDLRQIGAAMAREEAAWQTGRAAGRDGLARQVRPFLAKLSNGYYGQLPDELFAEARALLALIQAAELS